MITRNPEGKKGSGAFFLAAAVFAIMVQFAVGGVVRGAVFYVDPEAGDGSAEKPWKTAEQIFKQNLIRTRDKNGRIRNPQAPVKAGDTILLRSGYHGTIYFRNAYNDDFITIAAQKGHKPRLKNVFFSAAKKWIVRGLTVSPDFAPEHKKDRLINVVNWGGPTSDFVIENNTVFSSAKAPQWSADEWNQKVCYGILVIGERIIIRGNSLKYVDHGIVLTGDKITVERNSVEHIAADGIVCLADNASLLYNKIKYFYKVNANHDDAIQFHRGSDNDTPIKNALVRGNYIVAWDDKFESPLRTSPQGICGFGNPAVNWRIENNVVLVQHHHGITIYNCQNGVIVNNLAYNPYGGNFLAGISLGGSQNKNISKNNVVRNNLVDSNVIYPEGQNNIVENNFIARHVVRYFRDIDTLDMRHAGNSPAIDNGLAQLAPKIDINGVKRPQGPAIDLGPYEYTNDEDDEP
ncbi:MAG: choice-of-anchor Q domain-containing protein [Planctomycetota bacterium]|jgi:hypothetical protein